MAARPVAAQASGAPEFVNETDLALKRFGAKVVFATDGGCAGFPPGFSSPILGGVT
jgi:hypothetical protein